MIRPFRSRLCPAVRGGGFSMENYWIWCGSPAKGEDGRYHLFASRWANPVSFKLGQQFRNRSRRGRQTGGFICL